jgi:putative transposase
VWCPKYRRQVLFQGVDVRLKKIQIEVANEFNSEIVEMEVMPDHVQLLIDVDPQFGIAKVIRYMKGRSSRYVRQEFPWLKSQLPTLWTKSYFVSTVGSAPTSVIRKYIENQKLRIKKCLVIVVNSI